MRFLSLLVVFILAASQVQTTVAQRKKKFTRADKLRGSITPERSWWDLKHYHLKIRFRPDSKTIQGSNVVTFQVIKPAKKMQVDLQKPLEISKVTHADKSLKFKREDDAPNVYYIEFEEDLPKDSEQKIEIFYGGKPVESKRPPWSGGITWNKDKKGNPFIATTCQGIGASIWWPCKDHGYDEPDKGVDISVTVPEKLTAVANGRLKSSSHNKDDATKTFHWKVTHPINNYCVNVNIGKYVRFSEKYKGEGGELDMEYWALEHEKAAAVRQFREAPRTIEAFEHWFGKYPFYEDSYKLVCVPYLGMEHQSSVTYGNGFKNGYRGTDLSATGVGLKFDFIIVHETGHEWFGNNISMRDAADMWIHESFTNYSENLFVEYHFNRKEAEDYVIGCRKRVSNDRPIIGTYGVNKSGSGDMYYKGGNMLHTMRHIINDDKKWRSILRGLNKTFWHKTVTTKQVESYINKQSGIDFGKFFDQYLRTTKIPKFEYSIDGKKLEYRYTNVVDGFNYPIRASINGKKVELKPTTENQTLTVDDDISEFKVDRNFYVEAKKLKDK